MLRRIFEFMDLPKNVVQNLVEGNVSGAGRNVLDIVTGVTGLRLIPGLNKYLETTRDEKDRPSWGIVMDILSDPLTWISFGGAGAAKTLTTAAAKGATKRGLARLLSKQLTRAGAKRLTSEAAEQAARLGSRKGLRWLGALRGKPFSPGQLSELARRRILKQSAQAVLGRPAAKKAAQLALPGLLKQGGIQLGIPFMEGKTIALAGKDPLGIAAKGFLPYQAAKRIGPVRRAGEAVMETLRPLRKMGPRAQEIAKRAGRHGESLRGQWQTRVAKAFKEIPPDVAEDMGRAVHGFDPRTPGAGVNSLDTLFAKYADKPELLKRVQKGIADWQDMGEQMYKEVVDQGLLRGTRIDPRMYAPLQWSDEFAEAFSKAQREGSVDRLLGSGAATANTPFYKQRKFLTLEEFVGAGYTPELRLDKLAMRRVTSHARSMANARMTRQANTMLGAAPRRISDVSRARHGYGPIMESLGEAERAATGAAQRARGFTGAHRRGAEMMAGELKQFAKATRATVDRMIAKVPRDRLQLRNLTDSAFTQWFKKGAGRLRPRKGLEKTLNLYNRWLFKGPVTVGLGPWPNIAFITRNMISGVFQALTDENIGLAGFKHIRPVLEGLVSKVAQGMGGTYHGSVVNRLLQGSTKGVKAAGYSGDEIMEIVQRGGLFEWTFAGTEYNILQLAQRSPQGMAGKLADYLAQPSMQKWNFARQATEHTEKAMRLNSLIELLKRGVDPMQAVEDVTKAFIDYRYASEGERMLREVFPFAKFTTEQTPRTLEAIARRPVLTQPFRALMGGPAEGVLPQWMESRPTLDVGEGPAGERQVLTQFGTPLEDLEKLGTGEGIGRTLEQTIVGSLTPPLKWAYMATSGREPFYGREVQELTRAPNVMPDVMVKALGGKIRETPRGEYRQVPWQVTIAIQNLPVTRQIRQIDKLMDDRRSAWVKTLDLITGAKIYSVDEDRELRRRIRDYLVLKAQEGDIGAINRFFATGDTDPVLTRLIKDYYKIGKGGRSVKTKSPQGGVPGAAGGAGQP
jgi:hypothetical protein